MKASNAAKPFTVLALLAVVVFAGFQNCEHAVQGSRAFVQNSYGSSPICGIDENSLISCLGNNSRFRSDDQFQPDAILGKTKNAYDARVVGNFAAGQATTGYSCVLNGTVAAAAGGTTTNTANTVACFTGRLGDSAPIFTRTFNHAVSQITSYNSLLPNRQHACVLLNDGTVWCWQPPSNTVTQVTSVPSGVQEIEVYEASLIGFPVRPYLVMRTAQSVYLLGLGAAAGNVFDKTFDLQNLVKGISLKGASHLRSHQVAFSAGADPVNNVDIFYGLGAGGQPFVVTPFDSSNQSVVTLQGQQQVNANLLGTNLQKLVMGETHGCGLIGGNVVCYSSLLGSASPSQPQNPALPAHLYVVDLPTSEVGKIVDIEANDVDICAATAARNVYCWQGANHPAGVHVQAVLRHEASTAVATPTPAPTATPMPISTPLPPPKKPFIP